MPCSPEPDNMEPTPDLDRVRAQHPSHSSHRTLAFSCRPWISATQVFSACEQEVTVPSAHALVRRSHKIWEAARDMLQKGQARMKAAAADRGHGRPAPSISTRPESVAFYKRPSITCPFQKTGAQILRKNFKKPFLGLTHKSPGPDGIPWPSSQGVCRPAGRCLCRHFQHVTAPVCSPHMLQGDHHCPCPQENPKSSRLNDYRPVALTSTIMKCFERLVKSFITSSILDSLDPPLILRNFYSYTIKSILLENIIAWYGGSTEQDCQALQGAVRLLHQA
ncbi:hypothetical protein L3Q82_013715, partial [Scortum barcoo]